MIFATPASFAGVTSRLGFLDSISEAQPVDGAYVKFSGATLTGHTSNNSTLSTTATSYELSGNTKYRLVIEVNAEATLVTFALYADDSATVLWTDSLAINIPTARATGHAIISTLLAPSVVTNLLTVDYIDIYYTGRRVI